MARQVINTGTTANDGTGDTLRESQTKANHNFQELYGIVGSGYLPLDYGNLSILAKGVQGGVPNMNKPVKEPNDLVFGRVSPTEFWLMAVYNGPDPEDYFGPSYTVLSLQEIPT